VLLEKLELHGFKSFAQRTMLRLSPGITAVVGPNGCGKSNISDAIRWALGEQNVRNLRGKQLLDVIFKGTREAKPMGMAEVRLHMDNRDQRLATEYGEVTIQRRAFRSGESEFQINKAPCRLRDIRDLFMDTGLGSAEYAVIEREMIDEVLADRDSARRFLLDEASGITRYKQRRKETLRKIEAVEADLMRVEDALEIEEREVRSLAYQMGKARRYRRLTERIRNVDVSLARLRWRELSASASGESGRLSEEEREREGLLARIHQADARQEEVRLDLIELGRSLEAARRRVMTTEAELATTREEALVRKERVRSLGERVTDLEQRLTATRAERAEAQRAADALGPEVAELVAARDAREAHAAAAEAQWSESDRALAAIKSEFGELQQMHIEQVRRHSASDHRLQALQDRAAELERRADTLSAQHTALAARDDELQAELKRLAERAADIARALAGTNERRAEAEASRQALHDRLATLNERLAQLAEEEARRESRLHLLEEQDRSFQGYQEGVAQLLAHRDELPGLVGAVAELVSIAPAWEARLAPLLRIWAEWVVTADEASAWAAIDWLRSHELGQVTFLPLSGAPDLAGRGADVLPADALQARHPEGEALAQRLRGLIRLVPEREARPAEGPVRDERFWVTETGEVLAAEGWVSGGGRASPEVQLWRRPEEIDRLQRELEGLRDEREALRARQREALQQVEALEEELEALARERDERQTTAAQLERAGAEREAEGRLLQGERERLAAEEQQLAGMRRELQAAVDGSRHEQEEATAAASSADERLRSVAARVDQLATEKDQRGKVLTEKKMEAVWAQTRLRDAQTLLAQHETTVAEASERSERMERERQLATEEIASSKTRIEELGAHEAELIQAKQERLAASEKLDAERLAREESLASIEQQLRTHRRSLSELEEALRQNEVRLARVEAEKDRLRERLRDYYGLDLAQLEAETEHAEGAEAGAGAESAAKAGEADAAEAAALPSPEEVLGEETVAEAQERLERLRRDRERLGDVNVLAIEEHQRKKEHVEFIKSQRDDLLASREQLLAAIDRINVEARRLFAETFGQVQEHFSQTFATLFPGGEAHLRLTGEDPLEADIDIFARPRGKRLESIRLLSSGERALTATALLFGVYLVKPSPFCVLDEVDAPLDDANIERFVNLLRTFSNKTQFIVITHNKLTMETADTLYGVTMQEPGISKIVSVRLEGGRIVSDDRAADEALAKMTVN